jgi:ABC-type molybdenum transport system ATPase subunit/photorepair protein PhrA
MITSILREVRIKALFGYLDYTINFSKAENVSLLYGENGAGKTTVLRMIYAALSPNNGEGLRSYFRFISFRELSIETSIGTTVLIQKKKPSDSFYRYVVSTPMGTVDILLFREGDSSTSKTEGADLDRARDLLAKAGFDIHYLSDDRLLRSSSSYLATTIQTESEHRTDRRNKIPWLIEEAQGLTDRTWLNIDVTASQVTDAFRRQLLEQGNQGQRSTNNIYLDMANRLVSSWNDPSESSDDAFVRMALEIETLERERDELPMLKTLVSFPSREFAAILNKAPTDRRHDLVRILRPYLDSTRARTTAVTPLARILGLLVEELSSFFKRKTLNFDFSDSFVVRSPQGEPIPLGMLSSGEKQIFLLLCSAILSRRSPCIFLIDEPELSLNVYWQRSLPRTLQRLVEGENTQYVLATHSLEILTEFSEHITSLSESDNAAT